MADKATGTAISAEDVRRNCNRIIENENAYFVTYVRHILKDTFFWDGKSRAKKLAEINLGLDKRDEKVRLANSSKDMLTAHLKR